MKEDIINELTDVALKIKESIENKDLDMLRRLFSAKATINIMGRFYNVPELFSNLKTLFAYIEQPAMDIIQIEESEIKGQNAFATYLVEVFWVDQRTWDEHSDRLAMSLELAQQKKGWLVNGFTLNKRQFAGDEGISPVLEPPIGPSPAIRPGPGLGLDGLFSFWY